MENEGYMRTKTNDSFKVLKTRVSYNKLELFYVVESLEEAGQYCSQSGEGMFRKWGDICKDKRKGRSKNQAEKENF